MLEINNLKIEIDNKVIIEGLNLVVNKDDKLAIIGEEGNGKSTLLKAIVGDVDYAKVNGNINAKNHHIGYLKQVLDANELSLSAYDYLFNSEDDYYQNIDKLHKSINELNLSEEILKLDHMSNLSGGEKVKMQILKLLLSSCDILLLDEPTNDLDIKTLVWLEKFICNEKRPTVYVSHDETLLSKTANMILHLELLKHKEEPKWTIKKCGYDDYVNMRNLSINKQTQIAKKEKMQFENKENKLTQIMNKVEYQQATISRSNPHGGKLLKKKMKSLKSQEKRLDEKELVKVPDVEENINIFFNETSIPKSKTILDISISDLMISNVILSSNINLKINGNKHIVITGKNGIGKTTLLKYIYKMLKERTDIKVGYMPQNYDDILDGNKSPIDFLCHNNFDISSARSYLGNANFTRDEMTNKISNLSGGSKAKLIIVYLILGNYNVLLLDEPTRNVSPLSNPIIRNILKSFNGCIISVSHDRKYINEVCTEIYELTSSGLKIRKDLD